MSEQTTSTGSPTEEAAPSVSAELAQAIKERDEYLDQLRRTQAEFVNYQKRSKAQADADRLHLIRPLALDVLNALDNFDRAIDAARAAGATGIVDGLDMVEKQFVAALGKHGVEPITSLGQPFDPNLHEAIMQQPSSDHPENTVVAELVRGYKLHDRVLRPSKVAVSVRPGG